MQNRRRGGRVGSSVIMVVLCAGACQSVLDIEEPRRRAEAAAGAAGDAPDAAAGAPGGAGTPGFVPIEGGAGGEPPVLVGTGGAGEGGASATECEPGRRRCEGEPATSPEICDESGHWVHNDAEADGSCLDSCDAGRCVECTGAEVRCSDCLNGDDTCTQRMPQTCVDGVWQDANQPCEHYCAKGKCGQPPSCDEAHAIATDCGGESCCLSIYVPGGDFRRNYVEGLEPFANPNFTAELSPFLLDKFEVTVARMQQFVAAYDQLDLKEGDGKAPHIEADSGWRTASTRPANSTALKAALAACDASSTWTDGAGSAQKLPINCVDFNVAYAFCIWDGGRLPTDAEWNLAAVGGDEQWLYPWAPPLNGPPIDASRAIYESLEAIPSMVGSKPAGHGRWGHADLAGNVGEMVLDFYNVAPPEEHCKDCANLTASMSKVYRGGSYISSSEGVVATYPFEWLPQFGVAEIGFRCVRDVK
jgi:formylglycine-generating enzyme